MDRTVSLSRTDLENVQSSWQVVMQNADDNGMFIFKTFLTKYDYFPYFKKFMNTPVDELEENQAFRDHASSIIQAIDKVILNLDDEELIKTELYGLGKMHTTKNISETQFEELKVCILEILENIFKLPNEVVDSWRKTLNNAFVYIIQGLNSDLY